MDGYELCRKIKEDDDLKGITVRILTQLTEPEDIIKGEYFESRQKAG